MQWDAIAPFNGKGKIGVPYILFKAKNITDSTTRLIKWSKARPIAPTFAHPMSKLLHYTGRALYFIVNYMHGEHFIISDTNKVPQFFQHAMMKLQGSNVHAAVLDIEGCYPNMPKEIIRHSILDIIQKLRQQGRAGVYVPGRAKNHKCSWSEPKRVNAVFMHFTTLLQVLDFSLDQAIFRRLDGKLMRQTKGIPMGDALSPGMTIGTCGWMEIQWMDTIDDATKSKFAAARYMDDILIVYIDDESWDYARFLQDLERSDCYAKPLKLEAGQADIFLENEFTITTDGIRYWLKNANSKEYKIWRYQHINSYAPYLQKRATWIATLKKVDRMASDAAVCYSSAHDKLYEFLQLGYPGTMLKYACQRVGRETGHGIWFTIAKEQT